MEYSCAFCSRTEDEDPLIEISSNSLIIDQNRYEFSHIFHELFGITTDGIPSNFICETCKDSAVQFFIFKTSQSQDVNPHRKMIMSQIEDFLKTSRNIEEIKVVRKLYSITLQIDVRDSDKTIFEETTFSSPKQEDLEPIGSDYDYDDAPEDEEIESDFKKDEETEEPMEVETCLITCEKCGKFLTNDRELEVHIFFKHSMIGIHVNNTVNQVHPHESPRKCPLCSAVTENPLSHHLLEAHNCEIVRQVNDLLVFDSTQIDLDAVIKYISYINELTLAESLNRELEINVDEEIKNYFYELYAGDAIEGAETYEFVEEEDNSNSEGRNLKAVENKSIKSSVILTEEMRVWIKKEIGIRKKEIKNDTGTSRLIYRCAYCNIYSSNSAPGFRYHLISKHLKDNNFEELPEVESNVLPRELTNRIGRNTCNDCNLKFKDQKAFNSHQNCHDLFDIIAHEYLFPSCNTCSMFFIDELSFKKHLTRHEAGDAMQPIDVKVGAIILQGKMLLIPKVKISDDALEGFAWHCGHCTKFFQKEVSCRFHLLMTHVTDFACPIDKRVFSGFKAVSLFCHHLMNKHSEMFPNLLFNCTFCKMEFPSIYEKLAHMKTCSLKEFKCDHCGKMFFKKNDLLSHLKFISGEHYHACNMCQKRCETMSDLKIHIRTHTKERPFACSICEKCFRTLAARSAHLEGHVAGVLYNCHCGRSFKQRVMYRRHLKSVHGTNNKAVKSTLQKLNEDEEESH